MCYMDQVGVRELRQHASRVLSRIEAGESVEITNQGRPVARLVPVDHATARSIDALIDAGVVTPGRGDVLDVQPVAHPASAPTTEALLEELRAQ